MSAPTSLSDATANDLSGAIPSRTLRWNWILVLAFVGGSILAYLPVLNMPYLFMDENWITRTDDYDPEGNRSLTKMIALTQGRPMMGLWCKLTRMAAMRIGGLETMRLLRFGSMVCLGLFGCLLIRWLRRFDHGPAFAMVATAVVLSLPAYLILVAAGCWILPGLLSAAGSMPAAFYFLDRDKPTRFQYALGLILPLALLLNALATYQQCYLVCLPFLLVPVLHLRWDMEGLARRLRAISLSAAVILGALLVYYFTWQRTYIAFNPIPGEGRYNPMATVDLDYFFHHKFLLLFLKLRLPEALNLWEPNFTPTFTSRALMWLGAMGLSFHALLTWRSLGPKMVLDVAFKVSAVAATLVLADIFVLAAINDIGSFTTLPALSLTIVVVAAWSVSRIHEALRILLGGLLGARPLVALGRIAAVAIVLFCFFVANKRVTYHFALPLHLEMTSIRSELELHYRRHGGLNKIVVSHRDKNFYGNGYWEFAWTNLTHEFYIYWFTRNVLDIASLPSDVSIYASFSDGREVLANPPGTRIGGNPSIPEVRIDLSHVRIK